MHLINRLKPADRRAVIAGGLQDHLVHPDIDVAGVTLAAEQLCGWLPCFVAGLAGKKSREQLFAPVHTGGRGKTGAAVLEDHVVKQAMQCRFGYPRITIGGSPPAFGQRMLGGAQHIAGNGIGGDPPIVIRA